MLDKFMISRNSSSYKIDTNLIRQKSPLINETCVQFQNETKRNETIQTEK